MNGRAKTVAAAGLLLLAGASLGAADIWTKPFLTWTDKELEKLLDESPWTGKAGLTHAQAGGERQPIEDKVHVSWTSARPLRQGRVRESVGQNGTLTPELEAFAANGMGVYVLTFKVEGVSAAMAAKGITQVAKQTFLRRDGKEPLAVSEAQSVELDKDGKPVAPPKPPPQGGAAPGGPGGGGGFGGGFGGLGGFGGGRGGTAVIVFAFRKTDPITLDDKEVEIVSRVGQFNVRKKFKLKDMVIDGQLEL